jgi:hypothetical protein
MKQKELLFHTVVIIMCIMLMILTSCSEKAYLSRTGYVSEIDKKTGIYTVYFPCENQRYVNQRCGAWLDFKLDSAVSLFQKFEVK